MNRPVPSVTEELVRHPRIEGFVWGVLLGSLLSGLAAAIALWLVAMFFAFGAALSVRRIVLLKRELRRG